MLASLPGTPIRRLVLNDIGPFIPKRALERLGSYVGGDPHFADLGALETYLRRVHASFGRLTDAQWRHLARHGHRVLPDGGIGLAYDPAIGNVFKDEIEDIAFWDLYDRIRCPTLVIRGSESDLLPAETAQEMTVRGPRAILWEVPGVGHAPALMAEDQIARIHEFLEGAGPDGAGPA
jgi:pimeloyl-ACP methyl ester carboxylesterase